MNKRAIYTLGALMVLVSELIALFRASGYLSIQWSDRRPRSLNQNRLAFDWYTQIAETLKEGTAQQMRCECKLRFGVKILCRDDESFARDFDTAVKPMPYEHQLIVMERWPVTRDMNTVQLNEYLREIQVAYSGLVDLRFPLERAA